MRAKIRVYRQGLGDCILVRLRRRNGADYKILIDCGVAVATQDATTKMMEVVEDIFRETRGRIDALVVTHQHWDHVSGFTQAEELFEKFDVGEVWVAWTEDEDDPLAESLRKDHAKALTVLGACAQALGCAGRIDRALDLLNLVGLVGANGEKAERAFDKAKALAKQRRYWQPDEKRQAANQQTTPVQFRDPDVTIYALGPPYDTQAIRKTLPTKSNPETYELKIDGAATFPASMITALIAEEGTSPFAPTVVIPMEQAQTIPFFKEKYWSPAEQQIDWRRIDNDWLRAADELALAMQGATNNTSLVLAIELSGADVLLFAGDAQVGNCLSWQDRKWTVDGRAVTGRDLLARTVFYKVSHHGSHNATLREHGLNMMKNLKTAVIPVDQTVAKKMRWGALPLNTLVDELSKKTSGRTFRTDIAPPDAMPGVTVAELFYEFEV